MLRLPALTGDGAPVVLRPRDLADVLGQVITSHVDMVRHCRDGLLRHDELDQVWADFDKGLRPYFLELMHAYGLGIPLRIDVSDGGVALGATLVPAMLQSTDGAAYGVFAELVKGSPLLQQQGDCILRFSSMPSRLVPHFLVQLRQARAAAPPAGASQG